MSLLCPEKSMNFELQIPLFPGVLEVCICKSMEIHDWGKPDVDALGGYRQSSNKMWLNNEKPISDDVTFMSTIAHEACHAAFGIVDNFAGVYPDDMIGEENVCYIMDYLFYQIIERLCDVRKERDVK